MVSEQLLTSFNVDFLMSITFSHLFLAAQGLHCCLWAFSSCGEQGLLSRCHEGASH